MLLASVARQRWEKLLPDIVRSPVFARHDAYTLPGIFVMGTTIDGLLAGKTLATAQEVIRSLQSSGVTNPELEQARSEALSVVNKQLSKPEGVGDAWLDIDTYSLPSIAEQTRSLSTVSQNDLQRAATRLFRDAPVAAVVIGNSELVKSQIERSGNVELMGETNPKSETKPNQNPSKPQTKSAKPD
jgi:predicted Zn-dependent peptidase